MRGGRPSSVAVVGAGPVGSVLALGLARAGFRVTLLEAEAQPASAPRAATLHPSTLDMLGRLGLVDEVLRRGLLARYFDHWDRPSGTLIARFDHALLARDTAHPYVVQLEQHKLVDIAVSRLNAEGQADVRFSTSVVGVTQRAEGVRVDAEHEGERLSVEVDLVVGTDGGRSFVRKSQGIAFEGFTWPERFIVWTTAFDFAAERDYSFRNYLADPEEWTNLFKVSGEDGRGRWRAVFPVPPQRGDEQAVSDEAARAALGRLTDDPAAFERLEHRNLYRVHQRVAASLRAGRVLLAGDAAHVNNPIGGLGLNSGIHDATELVTFLERYRETGDETALDEYSDRRRALNVAFVQRQTVDNKRRLEERDATARAQRQRELREMADDPVRAREFLLRTSLLGSVGAAP